MAITLKGARVNAGLTQTEVAERLNVSTVSVNKWENGRAEPTFNTVKKLCELYGVDLSQIVI